MTAYFNQGILQIKSSLSSIILSTSKISFTTFGLILALEISYLSDLHVNLWMQTDLGGTKKDYRSTCEDAHFGYFRADQK